MFKRSAMLGLTLAAAAAMAPVAAQPAGPDGFTQTPVNHGPLFQQLSGFKGGVKMKHVEVRPNSWVHALAAAGNADMRVMIGFACPAGQKVEQIYYELGTPTGLQFVLQNGNSQREVRRQLTIRPFTADEYQTTGQQALGGPWTGDGDDHHNTTATVRTQMIETIRVFGNCVGGPTKWRDYRIIVNPFTVLDTDF